MKSLVLRAKNIKKFLGSFSSILQKAKKLKPENKRRDHVLSKIGAKTLVRLT